MEIKNIKKGFESIVFKEKEPFVSHREINWQKLGKILGAVVGIAVIVLLLLPAPHQSEAKFSNGNSEALESNGGEIQVSDTLSMGTGHFSGSYRSQASFDYLSAAPSHSRPANRKVDRASSMIISRPGLDSRNQLPPGARIPVRLNQTVMISSQPMPIIASVTDEVIHEDSTAIPQDSKIFGEISFDDASDRAQIQWRSIQFPDGRERQLSGIGLGRDGHLGIEGRVHSDDFKNTAGQFLSRFIGAYAEGSMQKGVLGASDGGQSNGFKNAVAETAKDRSAQFAEELKKKRRWIELHAGQELLAVLSQAFTFRDPGASHGP